MRWSPLPPPGEVAAEQRVRVALWQPLPPSSGLRPPSPALGRRDVAWEKGHMRWSPLPPPGEVAAEQRVRVALWQPLAPLIRPSATFSRVGEKGRGVGRRDMAWEKGHGEGRRDACGGHLSRRRERSLRSSG